MPFTAPASGVTTPGTTFTVTVINPQGTTVATVTTCVIVDRPDEGTGDWLKLTQYVDGKEKSWSWKWGTGWCFTVTPT